MIKATVVTHATPATAPAAKERPQAAASLLQRLNHALYARDDATTVGARSTPTSVESYSLQDARMYQLGLGWNRTQPQESRGFAQSEGYPADTDVDTRIHDGPAFGTFLGMKSNDTSEAPGSERALQPTLADELLTLLDRLSARVYVGEQRVLLTLESALPGAAAEIVREGAHLIIRLHASSEAAFRTLLTQRDALERTLMEHNLRHVTVEMMPVGGVAHERRD